MIYELKQTENTAPLFDGWQESLIWSCLQGVMGNIYTYSLEMPGEVMAVLGDFCFFAGRPNEELALQEPKQGAKDFFI